jgi:hypothetical protein
MGLVCLKGEGHWSGDRMCLWIANLAGFRDTLPAVIMQAYAGLGMQPSGDRVYVDHWFGSP